MNPIVDAVSGVFSGVVKPILDKWIPDAKDRMEAELFFYKNAHEVVMAQNDVNKEEAKSSSIFVAGWRPWIGWVCGAALAYASIVYYLLQWTLDVLAILSGQALPPLPKPDLGITLEILAGMLGLGWFRTKEKMNGVAS